MNKGMVIAAATPALLALGAGATGASAADCIYWTDSSGQSVGRATADGSGTNSNFVCAGALIPGGLAVTGDSIYWTVGMGPGPWARPRSMAQGSTMTSDRCPLS